MEHTEIILAGHPGALAHRVRLRLENSRCTVRLLSYPDLPPPGEEVRELTVVLFPFPGVFRQADARRTASDLEYLRSILDWARESKAGRVVLRSHAFAYGSSFKNYGLMEEDRISLLPDSSRYRRWLDAEDLVHALTQAFESPSAAVVRFCPILDPEEGDFLTGMLSLKFALPWAGYDPRIQLLDPEDAADALVKVILGKGRGVFNMAPRGVVPFRLALKAAVPFRLPVGGLLQKPVRELLWRAGLARHPGESIEQIRYNFTVSPEKAFREFGIEPRLSSSEALRKHLSRVRPGRESRIADDYDEFGLDEKYLGHLSFWFSFLRKVYWRVEFEGIENIPAGGPAMMVSNHRGFMPFDGVVHRSEILQRRQRHIRFLVIPSLFKFPFLSDFLIKQGGVVASQQNSDRLLLRGDLVGFFPEGINGAFRMYRGAYKMGPMGRDAFARVAIQNQVPVIPALTVGHVEIFPILGKIHWPAWKKWTGWPFFPITPTFPLLPIPLPTKWHVRYLSPITVDHIPPEEAANARTVHELSNRVKAVMQEAIDDMLSRRKNLFFGNIFEQEEVVKKDTVPS